MLMNAAPSQHANIAQMRLASQALSELSGCKCSDYIQQKIEKENYADKFFCDSTTEYLIETIVH